MNHSLAVEGSAVFHIQGLGAVLEPTIVLVGTCLN